jgi:hypothetical protein
MTAVQHLCRMAKYVAAFLVLYGVVVCVASSGGSAVERRAVTRWCLLASGAITLGVFAVRTWQKVKPVPPTPAPPPAAAPATPCPWLTYPSRLNPPRCHTR